MEVEGSGAPAATGAAEHVEITTEHVEITVVQGPEANHISEPLVPIVEVAFKHGQWWSLPPELSGMILGKMRGGEDVSYVYDWGENGRDGSFVHEGEKTKFSRYKLEFSTMTQTNTDNNRKRSFRIAYVRPQDVEARWAGQIPWTEGESAAEP